MISDIILWIFLGINTATDLKRRTIYTPVVILFGIAGVVLFICGEKRDIFSLAGGILTGGYLLLFSVLSREAIGFGDGLVVAVTGIWLGGWKTLLVLMGGFVLATLFGVAGICAKKAGRKSELPFVPFFVLSYMIISVGGCL